jgi:hypothetical protein
MESMETHVSEGIHIVKAICVRRKFVHELTKFIGNEMTWFGDKNRGQSQYRFSEIAKRVRERDIFRVFHLYFVCSMAKR